MENQQDNNFEEESIPEQDEQQPPEAPEESGYQPRPLWQRIGAWVALVLFVAVIIMYYIHMMRGGL